MGNALSVIAIVFTMFATLSIAYYAQKSREYAKRSHELNSTIQARDEEHRQEIRDLYQAMVICNIADLETEVTGTKGWSGKVAFFKKHYTGETQIFEL